MIISNYSPEYEDSWIRCRTLSFLYTQYYDDVLQTKPMINGIELVCIENDEVIGLLDIEIRNANCSYDQSKRGAMIETIAVHPDYQLKGIGNLLLDEAEKRLINEGIEYLEAWTREDISSNRWYTRNGFNKFNSYYHIFSTESVQSAIPGFYPIYTFGHITEVNQVDIDNIDRIYKCRGYVKVYN